MLRTSPQGYRTMAALSDSSGEEKRQARKGRETIKRPLYSVLNVVFTLSQQIIGEFSFADHSQDDYFWNAFVVRSNL